MQRDKRPSEILPSPCRYSFPLSWRWGLLCLFLIALLAPSLSFSAEEPRRAPYESALLIEAETGQVLFAHEPARRQLPASIVKMMVMLLVMEAVERREIDLDDPIRTSARASRIGGSQVYLKEGEVFPLRDLLKAMVIASANDAAVAIAEKVAGAVEEFVAMMNARARELGMTGTHYANVHGLPPGPGQEENFTTARDIALLARQLTRFPLLLKWGSTVRDEFRGGKFMLYNTNRLVRTFPGVDGFKTGHYGEAGFNLCATAEKGGLRLISVVLGSPSSPLRFRETEKLLSMGFRLYKKVTLFSKGDPVGNTIPVVKGVKKTTTLVAAEPVTFLIQRKDERQVSTRRKIPEPLEAPLAKGQRVGELEVVLRDQVIKAFPLLASEEIARKSWFKRLFDWW